MATTRVTRDALQAGDLPEVCVVTGREPDGTVDATLTWTPSWTYAFLLVALFLPWGPVVAVLGYLLASAAAQQRVPARLPITADAHRRYHRRTRVATLVALAGLLLLLGAVVVGGLVRMSPATGVAGGVGTSLLLVGLVARLVVGSWFVRVRPDGEDHVVLDRVSPAFASAVADRLVGR